MNMNRLTVRSFGLVCWILILSPESTHAQFVDPQNVLLQNVQLVDPAKADEPVRINILVQDNELRIVSEDPIQVDGQVIVVDARDGFLLGKLEIGKPPSFIILDKNPGDDIEVLLDTKAHTIFAVHDGRLLRNSLYAGDEVDEARSLVAEGWRAYTPPPMALPLTYLDKTKWNRWESKAVSGIFLAAVVLDRQEMLSQDDGSEQQFGDLDIYNGGEIRGLRFGAVGTINFKKPWVYTIFGATNAFDKGFETNQLDSVAFFDYRLDIPVFDKINLSIGKQKEPFSMERVMSMIHLPMQERSAGADALLPSRNFGVAVSSTAMNERMTWAGGVFNDWITEPGSIGENTTETMGRVTWLPFLSDDESSLVHLGVGARYSNAKTGLRFRSEPEFNKLPIFVDTVDALTSVDGSTQYSLEAAWQRGPFMLLGEYLRTDIDAPALNDPAFDSYYVTGSWILSGEQHAYRKKSGMFHSIPVSKTVNQGGWGAWEMSFRYSNTDLNDGSIDGGDMDILSLGINWWLTPVFNVNLNYRHVTLDRFGIEGSYSGYVTRVVLVLE
jgi:phosphate-selective porin OprO/OprP